MRNDWLELSVKFFLVALFAPLWWPVLREVQREIREATAETVRGGAKARERGASAAEGSRAQAGAARPGFGARAASKGPRLPARAGRAEPRAPLRASRGFARRNMG